MTHATPILPPDEALEMTRAYMQYAEARFSVELDRLREQHARELSRVKQAAFNEGFDVGYRASELSHSTTNLLQSKGS